MKKSFLTRLFITSFAAASFVIGTASQASLVIISLQDAEGGIVTHCKVGDSVEITNLDATPDIFGSDGDYATPNLTDTVALNDPSNVGGWTIKPQTESRKTKDGTLYSPTADVLSFTRWVVQYNSPNMLFPITPANRYNKWLSLVYTAKSPGLTTISVVREADWINSTSLLFKIQVDSATTTPVNKTPDAQADSKSALSANNWTDIAERNIPSNF